MDGSKHMPYLVCDKCGGYYELQLGESTEDFTNKCECGGNLKYFEDLNDADELQKICPNCGNVIRAADEKCLNCGFKIKKQPLTEKRLIFGFLWHISNMFFLSAISIMFLGGLMLIIVIFISHPEPQFSYILMIVFFVIFSLWPPLALIKVIRIFRSKYLRNYEKENLNWPAMIVSFFVTIVLGVFGGRYLPDNVCLVGPLIGGFVVGLMAGNRYIDGLVNGGIPAGMAASIGFIMLFLIFGNEIPSILNTPPEMILFITLLIVILIFVPYFLIGSIGGILGAAMRKRVNH